MGCITICIIIISQIYYFTFGSNLRTVPYNIISSTNRPINILVYLILLMPAFLYDNIFSALYAFMIGLFFILLAVMTIFTDIIYSLLFTGTIGSYDKPIDVSVYINIIIFPIFVILSVLYIIVNQIYSLIMSKSLYAELGIATKLIYIQLIYIIYYPYNLIKGVEKVLLI